MLDDGSCPSFGLSASPCGAGSAGLAAEAFSLYPESIICSLHDRLFANLSALQLDHTRIVDRLNCEITALEDEILDANKLLIEEVAAVDHAERSLTTARQAGGEMCTLLEKMKHSCTSTLAEARQQVNKLDVKAESLRSELRRLMLTQSIFLDMGKPIPDEEVNGCKNDMGVELNSSMLLKTTNTVRRLSGTWGGAPVTLEELALHQEQVVKTKGRCHGSTLSMSRAAWDEGLQRELRIAKRLRHPNLVEFFGAAIASVGVRFVSEPPLVPLALAMQSGREPDMSHSGSRFRVTLDLACAVEYLHCRYVAHRNIMIEHVYLRDAPCPTAKLGGLILVRLFCNANVASQRHKGSKLRRPTEDGRRTTFRSTDIQALGSLAFQVLDHGKGKGSTVLTGRTPRSSVFSRIDNRALGMVLMKCIEKDPLHRISASMMVRALRKIADGSVTVSIETVPNDRSCSWDLDDCEYEEHGDEAESSCA